jgi:hypothetical protein
MKNWTFRQIIGNADKIRQTGRQLFAFSEKRRASPDMELALQGRGRTLVIHKKESL